mgnify:CR=1 FL=1
MRHQKKRWFAALLSLCMLLSILPSTSLAFSESEETWSGNRRNQTIDGGTHTITLSNLTIDSPGVEKSAIDITGNADVTFILEGNNTLRGYRNHPAIWVESGSSVTFEGNGLLEASAGGASIGLGAAGIGGGYGASSNFGNITINGGTIIARGSGGGAGIGGVLEPVQAAPVIVEDNCFIGSRSIVVEGAHICREAVLGSNTVITGSTHIIDVTGPEPVTYKGYVPPRSVVVPGSYRKQFPAGEYSITCALIIGQRKESTDKKTSLNDALRDFGVSV